MCWQKYPISFIVNFTEKVDACMFSVYQALSPPLKGPGDEAIISGWVSTCKQVHTFIHQHWQNKDNSLNRIFLSLCCHYWCIQERMYLL